MKESYSTVWFLGHIGQKICWLSDQHVRPFEGCSVLVIVAICSFWEPCVNLLGGGVSDGIVNLIRHPD